jgi:hypothetical protein
MVPPQQRIGLNVRKNLQILHQLSGKVWNSPHRRQHNSLLSSQKQYLARNLLFSDKSDVFLSRRHCSIVKLFISITVTSGLFALCAVASTAAEPKKKSATVRITVPASSQMTLLATRKMLIERKKASREHLKNSLALYEDTLEKQMADYEIKKGLYQWELISKSE